MTAPAPSIPAAAAPGLRAGPRRFGFTNAELDAVRHDPAAWHAFVRRREFEMLMSLFDRPHFGRALELGAGDGGQSATICQYCDHLVCTELAEAGNPIVGRFEARNLPNVEYRLCDAQDLSAFGDGQFDLVFSSNMLEHVPDAERCLRECKRVLKPGGWIVHTMPGRAWKVFSFTLNLWLYRCRPAPHGVSQTHFQEWQVFGPAVWRRRFAAAGLRLVRQVGLPFYVGHANRCAGVSKLGNRCGLSATFAYLLQK